MVGIPAPIRMQAIAVSTRVKKSASAPAEIRPNGSSAASPSPQSRARLVIMNDILKPIPVSDTTPTTMPTAAAAAPTASAYLAPS